MRLKSNGSSTIGMKKSVVAMMQVFSVVLPHRGVVAGLGADQKLPERCRHRLIGKKLLQHRWRELAAAAAAVRERGQSNDGYVHGVIPGSIIANPRPRGASNLERFRLRWKRSHLNTQPSCPVPAFARTGSGGASGQHRLGDQPE